MADYMWNKCNYVFIRDGKNNKKGDKCGANCFKHGTKCKKHCEKRLTRVKSYNDSNKKQRDQVIMNRFKEKLKNGINVNPSVYENNRSNVCKKKKNAIRRINGIDLFLNIKSYDDILRDYLPLFYKNKIIKQMKYIKNNQHKKKYGSYDEDIEIDIKDKKLFDEAVNDLIKYSDEDTLLLFYKNIIKKYKNTIIPEKQKDGSIKKVKKRPSINGANKDKSELLKKLDLYKKLIFTYDEILKIMKKQDEINYISKKELIDPSDNESSAEELSDDGLRKYKEHIQNIRKVDKEEESEKEKMRELDEIREMEQIRIKKELEERKREQEKKRRDEEEDKFSKEQCDKALRENKRLTDLMMKMAEEEKIKMRKIAIEEKKLMRKQSKLKLPVEEITIYI